MKRPTDKQIYDAVKFLRHWDKKATLRDGYWFKMIGDTQVEIFNVEETEYIVIDLPVFGEIDILERELGIGKYAPQEPLDDSSLFGVKDHKDIKTNKPKSDTFMSDEEWHKKKMPLPTFYNTHK